MPFLQTLDRRHTAAPQDLKYEGNRSGPHISEEFPQINTYVIEITIAHVSVQLQT